jgi:hypothetical protein
MQNSFVEKETPSTTLPKFSDVIMVQEVSRTWFYWLPAAAQMLFE